MRLTPPSPFSSNSCRINRRETIFKVYTIEYFRRITFFEYTQIRMYTRFTKSTVLQRYTRTYSSYMTGDLRFRYMSRALHNGAVPGTRGHIPAGRPMRMRTVVTAFPQQHGQVLPAGGHRPVCAGSPVPRAAGRHKSGVHVQGRLHQVVRRRRVLQTVHTRPVRRGQHVQREHYGHRHGRGLRGRAVHRGQAVLPGRQGVPPGRHAGPLSGRPDRAVPGHGQDVHRGRFVPGHVRLRERGRRAADARGPVVLRVVAVRGRRPVAHVQAAAAAAARGQKTRRCRRTGGGQARGRRAAAAAGPVRPPAGHDRVERPVVQAAVPAGAVRPGRVGGAGPRQGHAEGPGLEDGQVRVPARVHGRAGAGRRQQRHRVPAAHRHAGQVPEHERRVQQERDQDHRDHHRSSRRRRRRR